MENKWKRLLSYYKPYKGLFAADMFFALLAATVTLIIPLIVKHITGKVIYLESGEALNKIIFLGIFMLVLVGIECYSNYFISYYGHIMGAKIEYNMRNELFSHYQKLSCSFYDNQKVGQLMSRITNDLFDITELLHHGPEDLIISVIRIVGTFGILLYINYKLAIAAFIIIPFLVVFAFICNVRMKKAFKNNRIKIGEINTRIEDSLSGIKVVKSFANEEIEKNKFIEGNHAFLDSKKKTYKYMGVYQSGVGVMTTLITLCVVLSGAIFITNGAIEPTELITFVLYINNFTEPIKKLINFTEQFQNGFSGYERFLEMLDVKPEITDCENPIVPDKLKGELTFKKVTFKYEEGTENVLENVDLNIGAGEYIALVGKSGVGKTTLCSLVPRFYDVTNGEILLDGINIKNIKLSYLRENIGIVQQDVYLFAGTVIDNIRYGKPEATDEEIIQAAKSANAHEFIMNLPEGYNTDIGQRGVKLSGGQKQRLSIARVFLKNPPILILDEATSALDNESERVVWESLEKLAKGRTTLVIAHRLSTIENAERIVVLTKDGVVESGTHTELLNKGGIYEKLYRNKDNINLS